MESFKKSVALGVCWLGLVACTAAFAEVLVMKDGSRVETRGDFEIRGRRVVFTDARGKLATLRLDDVDLEASRAANQPAPVEAATADPSAPAPKKTPVLVLTDRDVAHVDPEEARAAPELRIVIYTTSWCGYCRKARVLLDQLGVSYEDRDIEKSAAARRERDRLAPSCGVPVIDIGGETICGFAEQRIRSRVAEIGKRKAEAAATAAAAKKSDDG